MLIPSAALHQGGTAQQLNSNIARILSAASDGAAPKFGPAGPAFGRSSAGNSTSVLTQRRHLMVVGPLQVHQFANQRKWRSHPAIGHPALADGSAATWPTMLGGPSVPDAGRSAQPIPLRSDGFAGSRRCRRIPTAARGLFVCEGWRIKTVAAPLPGTLPAQVSELPKVRVLLRRGGRQCGRSGGNGQIEIESGDSLV